MHAGLYHHHVADIYRRDMELVKILNHESEPGGRRFDGDGGGVGGYRSVRQRVEDRAGEGTEADDWTEQRGTPPTGEVLNNSEHASIGRHGHLPVQNLGKQMGGGNLVAGAHGVEQAIFLLSCTHMSSLCALGSVYTFMAGNKI